MTTISPSISNSSSCDRTNVSIVTLGLSALGIVFGDLGTSPLYALQEAFHAGRGVLPIPANVIGSVSLFLWALIIMVSIKYVFVLMRADNRGEGGILALLTLVIGAGRTSDGPSRRTKFLIFLGMIGTAMLYGDGAITPAISVLSAIEGLQVATPAFAPYIVPITVIILVALFAIQPYGSGKVGIIFGPILLLWFITIAALGLNSLLQNPTILQAVNPLNAVRFFAHNGSHGFIALGAVVLCLTGGEALYADMGHFGRRPIQLAWYTVALPALLLNYLGQGALLLTHPEVASKPFYAMVPTWGLYPTVVLAALATIVASQALIAAVFSLTRQAAQLGYSPRVEVVQTSGTTIGQVYLPTLNWILMLVTIAIVLLFKTSDSLASAYGLAVSVTMALTTVLFAALARREWKWSWLAIAAVAGTFMIADLAFVLANALKFLDGGWLPMLIGGVAFFTMAAWFTGRKVIQKEHEARTLSVADLIESLSPSPPNRIHGCAVFLTANPEVVPAALLHQLKHNQVLHEQVVLLHLVTEEVPYIALVDRLQIAECSLGFINIAARFGFMEEPHIPNTLRQASALHPTFELEEMTTTYFLSLLTMLVDTQKGRRGILGVGRRAMLRFFVYLVRNEHVATLRFGLPINRVVQLGQLVELR